MLQVDECRRAACSLQVLVSEMLLLLLLLLLLVVMMTDDAVGGGPRGGCQSGMARALYAWPEWADETSGTLGGRQGRSERVTPGCPWFQFPAFKSRPFPGSFDLACFPCSACCRWCCCCCLR